MTTKIQTILLAMAVVSISTIYSQQAFADTIDFETGFVDQQSIGAVVTTTNTVTFGVGPSSGPTGPAFIAGVGNPTTAYVPTDNIPAASSTGGLFFLTDEFNGPVLARDYFMSFATPISSLSLDLYDYRGDGTGNVGDTAILTVFDASSAPVGVAIFTVPAGEPDPNLAVLSIPATSGPGISAHLAFSGTDVGTGIDNITFTTVLNSAPDCSAASPSIDTIWPPNHKFVDVTILGVTDADADTVSITVDSIMQDEPLNAKGNGDGNTSPDGAGVGTDTAQVRAERAGTGDGRVYEISFTANDGNGGSCSASVEVGVPHNKKSTPVNSGLSVDSTGP